MASRAVGRVWRRGTSVFTGKVRITCVRLEPDCKIFACSTFILKWVDFKSCEFFGDQGEDTLGKLCKIALLSLCCHACIDPRGPFQTRFLTSSACMSCCTYQTDTAAPPWWGTWPPPRPAAPPTPLHSPGSAHLQQQRDEMPPGVRGSQPWASRGR